MKKFYYFEKPIIDIKGKVDEIEYEMIPVYHSILSPTVGFIINIDNKRIGYFPDFLDFKNKEDKNKLKDLDILIAGASSISRNIVRKGNIGHLSMKNWLELVKGLNIKKIIFTHYGKEVVEKGLNKTYEDLKKEYQDIDFKLAFDNYKTKIDESITLKEVRKLLKVMGLTESIMKNYILPYIPPHKTFVEVFGGGSNIWVKRESDREVYNDIDPEFVFMFRFLKRASDETLKKISERKMENTKEFFQKIKTKYENKDFKDDEDKFYIILYLNLSKLSGSNYSPDVTLDTKKFKNLYERLINAKKRCKNLIIENMDFEDLITKYDSENTLFYMDPPYPNRNYWSYSFKEKDWERLKEIVKSIKGKWLMITMDSNGFLKDFREKYDTLGFRWEKSFAYLFSNHMSQMGYIISNYDKHKIEKYNKENDIDWYLPMEEYKVEESEQQKEIMYIPNFISIVGSRAIGNYNENSDWDILIRKEKRDESLELLIRRYFGKDKKLHFIYTPYGPHGDYIPLYDLKLVEIPERKVILIESNNFEPVKNYTPPKMGASYSFEEFYDIEELINKWANSYFERGIKVFVEKKLNGWRGIIQKKDKEIGIFFEGTKDNRKNQFKKLTDLLIELDDDFILDTEFSAKEVNTGKIISRKDLASWGHNPDKEIDIDSFETPEGVKAKLNIVLFDIPYLDEDISKQMLKERRKILEDFYKKLPKEYFELINYYVVSNPKELKDAVEKVSNMEASEGAVLKSENSIYLKEEIPDWAKFKKIVEIKVQILEKMKTKDGNAFNYVVGYLKDGKLKELCKTMNTKIDAEIGDILTLSCEEIILNIENGEIDISIQIPRVRDIDLNRKEPDDLNTIIEKGYKGKILQATNEMINELKKRKIIEASDEGDTGGDWKKDFLDYFEKVTLGEFVLQEHERGLTEEQAKSNKRYTGKENIHCDLRFYIKKPTELPFLIGVTLATPSKPDLPNKIIEPDKGKVLIVGFKKKQPLSWLDVGKGEIDLGGGHIKINIYGKEFKADLNEPGGVGSTSNTWSRFIAIDEGQFEILEKGNHHLLIEFKGKNKFLDGIWSISGAPLDIEPKFGNRVWFFQKKSGIMNKGEEK